jgi:hypothetical protein
MCSGRTTYCKWPVTGLLDTEKNGSHVYDDSGQTTRLHLWYLYAVVRADTLTPISIKYPSPAEIIHYTLQ